MKYKCVTAVQRGGPETLQIFEKELRPPLKSEVRVQVLAASVSLPDIEARYGHSPFPPRLPFVPGYAVTGVVEAAGPTATHVHPGDLVAALTVYGGYSERVYVPENKLIPVPAFLDPAEVVPLILNYIVAYQCLHRTARVQAGQKALIIGASGGIGTAFLQLGRLAGLTLYGLASRSKAHIVQDLGAFPVDYQSQDFTAIIRQKEPAGLDVVFDGMGGDYLPRGLPLLRRGGRWVSYANPRSLRGIGQLLGRALWHNLIPGGKSIALYGTGASYLDQRPFLEDWAALFRLLAEKKIAPVIAARFPLLEAPQANALLESGGVIGNIVLINQS